MISKEEKCGRMLELKVYLRSSFVSPDEELNRTGAEAAVERRLYANMSVEARRPKKDLVTQD